jgi:hypothetical protein
LSSRDRNFKAGMERLGTASLAVGFAGAIAASRVQPRPAAQLEETAGLLREIRQVVEAPRASAAEPEIMKAAARDIDTALQQIEQLAKVADWSGFRALADGACVVPGQPAVLLFPPALSTGRRAKAT